MEGFTDCRQRLVALQHHAKAQADALKILQNALAQEAAHLHRLGQARSLDALRARVTDDVEEIEQLEAKASYNFTSAKLISGLGKFTIGSLRAALRGTQQHPFFVGAKLAADDFAQTRPFHIVMVAIGANGVPDEVYVIPVSQWARDLGKSESEIVATLKKPAAIF